MTKSRQFAIDSALQEVSDALGLVFIRSFMPKEHEFDIDLRLEKISTPYGFSIKIIDDYLVWRIELLMDFYSGPLLTIMQSRSSERKDEIESFFELAKARNNFANFLINKKNFDFKDKQEWSDLSLQISKSYFSVENEFPALSSALLDFMCIVLYLLVEDVEWAGENSALGEKEGSKSSAVINKYERSRYNRALCLKYFGFTCRGCGELLAEKYGPLGIGVIHVHHIVPISQMGDGYRLNPIKDLVPLCPNCHMVVHKTNPPISISELRVLTKYEE